MAPFSYGMRETENLRGICEARHAYPTIDLSLFFVWLSLFMFKFLTRVPQTTWRPGLGLYTSRNFQNSLALLNKILIWLASAPILLIYDLCMLFLRWLNIATKSKLAWLKRIFLFPNALFRIQYSSAENTIPGGLHFALFRIDISTTRVVYNNIQECTGVSI